jgi:hypothetical protein
MKAEEFDRLPLTRKEAQRKMAGEREADLTAALEVALAAHREQKDKAGEPYILHVMRVVCAMKSDEERIAAALHDVVEDSSWSFEDLEDMGFGKRVVDALMCLTRCDGEAYMYYVGRCASNPLAKAVKVEDLRDHLRGTPSLAIGHEQVQKYRRALLFLLDRGDEHHDFS